ncbi:cytochrome P450 [Cylindrospermum sp. NIES-4074]|nr:cytochrome P450 [Cylindrospermum sp. NIES-4074]
MNKILGNFLSLIGLNDLATLRKLGDIIPGPPANPLLGNLPDLQQAGGFQNYLPALHKQYGSIVKFWLGPLELGVSVSDIEILGEVTNNLSARPDAAKKLLGWMGKESITFQKPPELITTRSNFFHLLIGSSLQNLCSVSHEQTVKMLDSWSQRKDAIDVKEEFSGLTLNIVGSCSFGQEFGNTSLGQEIRTLFKNVLVNSQQRLEEVVPPVWDVNYHQWNRDVSRLHECAGELITQRKQAGGLRQSNDLLSLVLNERNDSGGQVFTDAEARAAVVSFLFGGFDPAGSSLTWACYLLATHPEIQALARSEVERVLAGRLPELEDLPRLEYLNRVIKESLRLYTPNPVTMRLVESDIPIGDYTIPTGATFCIPICVIHKDPTIWPNPDNFDPDRFLPEQEQARPRYAYIPFGMGARGCVGARFGTTQVQLMLSMILQRFSLTLSPDQEIASQLEATILQPKFGLKLLAQSTSSSVQQLELVGKGIENS